LELAGQVPFVVIKYRGVANRLDVLGRRQRKHAIAEAHRLEQCGVRAADFGSVHITISVLLQRAIILPKNKSREDDRLSPRDQRVQGSKRTRPRA
jgi:hypothetical protein